MKYESCFLSIRHFGNFLKFPGLLCPTTRAKTTSRSTCLITLRSLIIYSTPLLVY